MRCDASGVYRHFRFLHLPSSIIFDERFVKKKPWLCIAGLFPAIALVLLFGCNGGNTASSSLDEMNFNVHDSLLAPPVKDAALGITFRPPRGWTRVDQHIIDSARAIAIEKMGSKFDRNESMQYVYTDSATGSVLAVMRIDSFDVADSSASVRQFIAKLRAVDSSLRIETAVFKKGDLRVHQVRVVSGASVTLRMTFDNLSARAPVFAFNYILPRDYYSAKALEIESSVGSLQPLSSIQ
jgi:hypothetical protein